MKDTRKITLSNGTQVTTIPADNGSQNAVIVPVDRPMTESEWNEYCGILAKQNAETLAKIETVRKARNAAFRLKATPWPNDLGWDVADSEVFKHDYRIPACLRVFTPKRTALVASTDDPVKAVILTRLYGHLRSELADMDHTAAQQKFDAEVL